MGPLDEGQIIAHLLGRSNSTFIMSFSGYGAGGTVFSQLGQFHNSCDVFIIQLFRLGAEWKYVLLELSRYGRCAHVYTYS